MKWLLSSNSAFTKYQNNAKKPTGARKNCDEQVKLVHNLLLQALGTEMTIKKRYAKILKKFLQQKNFNI